MSIRVCVAGATGWAGSALVKKILVSQEFILTGAIARQGAGEDIGVRLGGKPSGVQISATFDEALRVPADVLVDYTKPDSVKARTLAAMSKGLRVVIGTSGLTAADYDEIATEATKRDLGVIAAGNFSITAALAKHFALFAAQHIPSWEIIDYAHAEKPDAPSGTARELAEELGNVAKNRIAFPIDQTHGTKETRGGMIAGTPVHSIRLPSYVISFETIFGMPDERLTIRHDSGTSAEPYVGGTLLAIREVMKIKGLVRGLDRLLFSNSSKPQ
ncbi:MAG TPA: 4-hydroxy-tetrahydrodipicolinate reductase [Candidatus Acidoferrales bacterium]